MITLLKDKIAEIYSGGEDFTVGKCILDSDDAVLIEALDLQGKWDGFYWMKKNTLTEVIYDSEYIDKMKLYVEYWNDKKEQSDNHPTIPYSELSANINDLLKLANQKKSLITIMRNDEEELDTGFIKSIENDKFTLECIDISSAKMLEILEVKTDEVVFAEIDSIDNRLLEYAYSKNK